MEEIFRPLIFSSAPGQFVYSDDTDKSFSDSMEKKSFLAANLKHVVMESDDTGHLPNDGAANRLFAYEIP